MCHSECSEAGVGAKLRDTLHMRGAVAGREGAITVEQLSSTGQDVGEGRSMYKGTTARRGRG